MLFLVGLTYLKSSGALTGIPLTRDFEGTLTLTGAMTGLAGALTGLTLTGALPDMLNIRMRSGLDGKEERMIIEAH
jgi:zinc transporter ZupT